MAAYEVDLKSDAEASGLPNGGIVQNGLEEEAVFRYGVHSVLLGRHGPVHCTTLSVFNWCALVYSVATKYQSRDLVTRRIL